MAATKKAMAARAARSLTTVSTTLAASGANMMGEMVWWTFPANSTYAQVDVAAACVAAGLDAKKVKALAPTWAFVRAVRKLETQRLIRNVVFEPDVIKFLYDFEATVSMAGGVQVHNVTGLVTLDKETGVVSCADPKIEAEVVRLMTEATDRRPEGDMTRLVKTFFEANDTDLVMIKWPCPIYFVWAHYLPFVDKVEKFVTLLGGVMGRIPVPDGTTAVVSVVADYNEQLIKEYEQAVIDVRTDTSDKQLAKLQEAVSRAYTKLSNTANYLGSHVTALEDHLALVSKLLADKEAERAKTAGSGLVVV